MTKVVEITNLKYKNLFNNLSITVEKNKFVTISGPNNCGKTTLIRILSRLISTDESIIINDKHIAEYKLDNYLRIVQTVIPKELIFLEDNLEEEMYYNQTGNPKEINELINFIVSGLKIKKILTKSKTDLSKKEIILSQLAIALSKRPRLLLLANISSYFDKKELNIIFNFLKEYRDKYTLTLIQTTIDLDASLLTDYIYIINEGQVALEGIPLEVLQKDNIINKIGLEIPFMIDLSVKLRDYDLVNEIETDLDRMVDKLWN